MVWIVLLLGCAPPDADGGPRLEPAPDTATAPGPSPGPTPTWSADVAPVLSRRCAPCHIGDDAEGLDLAAGRGSVVEVPSQQLPSMALITPGEPLLSYLWHKCADTHDGAGGRGGRMPPTRPLEDDQLDALRRWIAAGAADD